MVSVCHPAVMRKAKVKHLRAPSTTPIHDVGNKVALALAILAQLHHPVGYLDGGVNNGNTQHVETLALVASARINSGNHRQRSKYLVAILTLNARKGSNILANGHSTITRYHWATTTLLLLLLIVICVIFISL